MTYNFVNDAAKELKNSQHDCNVYAKIAQNHTEGKPRSETLNKAEE